MGFAVQLTLVLRRAKALAFTFPMFALAGCDGESRSCALIEKDAIDLIAASSACSSDSDCALQPGHLQVPNSCLMPFHCDIALRKDFDATSFWARANSLSQDYKKSCTTCVQAKCSSSDSSRAVCDPESKRCVARLVPVRK